MQPEFRSAVRAAALAATVLLACGCGGTKHDSYATGIVTLDGQPVSAGTVTFHPLGDGPRAYGAIGPDSKFLVRTGSQEGLPHGEYAVTVVVTVRHSEENPGETGRILSPRRYADENESGLRITIGPGENQIDVPLTSD